MESFKREREATVQFNDVFGRLPLAPLKTNSDNITDFDAALTAQVRNTNHFVDAQFSIDAWPKLGDYGVVLLDQLRQQQIDEAGKENPTKHPDVRTAADYREHALVGVVNCAPRRADHHHKGVNGDGFFAGITASGVEVYAQLPYFQGLAARSRLIALYSIPDDAGVWPSGEQFRSSIVSMARRYPDRLHKEDLSIIPPLDGNGRVAYTDKFGNVRLELHDGQDTLQKLVKGHEVKLRLGEKELQNRIQVVSRLTEIPEGKLCIYFNPADPGVENGPHYVELARRVSDPNAHGYHAYDTLRRALGSALGRDFRPTVWDNINVQIITN